MLKAKAFQKVLLFKVYVDVFSHPVQGRQSPEWLIKSAPNQTIRLPRPQAAAKSKTCLRGCNARHTTGGNVYQANKNSLHSVIQA